MTTVKGNLTPLRGKVFVEQLEAGQRVSMGGILIPDDNMKNHGIRPRWGKVYAVGEGVTQVKVGQWVMMDHGRWSFGVDIEQPNGELMKVWQIDFPNGVLLVSDSEEYPADTQPISK